MCRFVRAMEKSPPYFEHTNLVYDAVACKESRRTRSTTLNPSAIASTETKGDVVEFLPHSDISLIEGRMFCMIIENLTQKEPKSFKEVSATSIALKLNLFLFDRTKKQPLLKRSLVLSEIEKLTRACNAHMNL